MNGEKAEHSVGNENGVYAENAAGDCGALENSGGIVKSEISKSNDSCNSNPKSEISNWTPIAESQI